MWSRGVVPGLRETLSLILTAGLSLSVAACGAGSSDGVPASAPQRPGSGGGVWVGPKGEVLTNVAGALGPKIHIFAGQTLGYELTVQAATTYRFRWTTDNLANHTGVRRFTGSVYTPGRFATFALGCDDGSCDLEAGDHVSGVQPVPGGGERIDWDTLAKDGWDGFSFTTDAALYFEINVDGRPRPELLEVVTWNQPYAPPTRVGAPAFPPAVTPAATPSVGE
jgi:hypothetical protein